MSDTTLEKLVDMPDLDDLLAGVQGEPIRGGCDLCDAVQSFEQVEPNVWTVVIAHDDWCPFIRSRNARSN